jgi:acetyl esterase/lipase
LLHNHEPASLVKENPEAKSGTKHAPLGEGVQMHADALKALLIIANFLGRTFVFNRNVPAVGRVVHNLRYGNHPAQVLDVFVPQASPPFPVLVYIHGGGWVSGTKESYTRVCSWFANKGYLVFNVDYRLAPEFRCPAQMQDVAAAIHWVSKSAKEFGGDNSQIFLAGDSAGAHLASWYAAALTGRGLFERAGIEEILPQNTIGGLVLFYGVFDLETFAESTFAFCKTMAKAFLGKDPKSTREEARTFSPLHHVTEGLPPFFLCAGEKDPACRVCRSSQAKGGAAKGALLFRKRIPRCSSRLSELLLQGVCKEGDGRGTSISG